MDLKFSFKLVEVFELTFFGPQITSGHLHQVPISLLYPRLCLGCQTIGSYICPDCQKKINPFPFQFQLKDTFVWLKYQGLTKKAIHQLKYRFTSSLAQDLINLALGKQSQEAERFKREFKDYLITPVPLYWQRKNWRGFNQSASLGKVFAGELNLKFDPNLIKRTKKTELQVNLARQERQTNLKDAFLPINESRIINKKIIVFDDVLTTGTTLREAGKTLKKAGANRVLLMALAG